MPMITLKIAHPRAEALVGEAAALVASLAARLLGRDPRKTSVAVDVVPLDRWFVAGQSLAEQKSASVFVEVRVPDAVTTKDQKESFIAETFTGFQALLGALHPVSFVHVIDVNADGYGWGARSMERRYIESRPRPDTTSG
jgi:4-oxalocrotonate tautomerase